MICWGLGDKEIENLNVMLVQANQMPGFTLGLYVMTNSARPGTHYPLAKGRYHQMGAAFRHILTISTPMQVQGDTGCFPELAWVFRSLDVPCEDVSEGCSHLRASTLG